MKTMKNPWTGIGILLLAVVVLTGGCVGSSSEDPQEMQLRTYRLPEGQDVKTFRNYLRNSLDTGDQSLGTVTTYPDGSLVVTAPVSVHDGIEDLIGELTKRGPEPAKPPPSSVTVNYWFLLGKPIPGGESRIASQALQQSQHLQPVLKEIVKAQGGMEFHLLEQMRLISLDNNSDAEVRGRRVAVRQEVLSHDSGQRLADIKVTMFGKSGVLHTLQSRIKLEPGKFIILGQTAYNNRDGGLPQLAEADEQVMLYYVLSAEAE